MKIVKDGKEYNVKMCISFFSRLKGLMFKKNIDEILCFNKCSSIHTFFMLRNISVVMTDKNFNILYVFYSIKPWKIILPKKKVYYTFEFKENLFKYKIGDKIQIKK